MQVWHENGQLKSQFTMYDQRVEGLALTWFDSGEIRVASCYRSSLKVAMSYCAEKQQ